MLHLESARRIVGAFLPIAEVIDHHMNGVLRAIDARVWWAQPPNVMKVPRTSTALRLSGQDDVENGRAQRRWAEVKILSPRSEDEFVQTGCYEEAGCGGSVAVRASVRWSDDGPTPNHLCMFDLVSYGRLEIPGVDSVLCQRLNESAGVAINRSRKTRDGRIELDLVFVATLNPCRLGTSGLRVLLRSSQGDVVAGDTVLYHCAPLDPKGHWLVRAPGEFPVMTLRQWAAAENNGKNLVQPSAFYADDERLRHVLQAIASVEHATSCAAMFNRTGLVITSRRDGAQSRDAPATLWWEASLVRSLARCAERIDVVVAQRDCGEDDDDDAILSWWERLPGVSAFRGGIAAAAAIRQRWDVMLLLVNAGVAQSAFDSGLLRPNRVGEAVVWQVLYRRDDANYDAQTTSTGGPDGDDGHHLADLLHRWGFDAGFAVPSPVAATAIGVANCFRGGGGDGPANVFFVRELSSPLLREWSNANGVALPELHAAIDGATANTATTTRWDLPAVIDAGVPKRLVKLTGGSAAGRDCDALRRLAGSATAEVFPKSFGGLIGLGWSLCVTERFADAVEFEEFAPFASSGEAAVSVAGLLHALALLSSAGIVHRDLHSSNVLVVPGGAVRIVDFTNADIIAEDDLHCDPIFRHADYFHTMNMEGRPPNRLFSDVFAVGGLLLELPQAGVTPEGVDVIAVGTALRIAGASAVSIDGAALQAIIDRTRRAGAATRRLSERWLGDCKMTSVDHDGGGGVDKNEFDFSLFRLGYIAGADLCTHCSRSVTADGGPVAVETCVRVVPIVVADGGAGRRVQRIEVPVGFTSARFDAVTTHPVTALARRFCRDEQWGLSEGEFTACQASVEEGIRNYGPGHYFGQSLGTPPPERAPGGDETNPTAVSVDLEGFDLIDGCVIRDSTLPLNFVLHGGFRIPEDGAVCLDWAFNGAPLTLPLPRCGRRLDVHYLHNLPRGRHSVRVELAQSLRSRVGLRWGLHGESPLDARFFAIGPATEYEFTVAGDSSAVAAAASEQRVDGGGASCPSALRWQFDAEDDRSVHIFVLWEASRRAHAGGWAALLRGIFGEKERLLHAEVAAWGVGEHHGDDGFCREIFRLYGDQINTDRQMLEIKCDRIGRGPFLVLVVDFVGDGDHGDGDDGDGGQESGERVPQETPRFGLRVSGKGVELTDAGPFDLKYRLRQRSGCGDCVHSSVDRVEAERDIRFFTHRTRVSFSSTGALLGDDADRHIREVIDSSDYL